MSQRNAWSSDAGEIGQVSAEVRGTIVWCGSVMSLRDVQLSKHQRVTDAVVYILKAHFVEPVSLDLCLVAGRTTGNNHPGAISSPVEVCGCIDRSRG